MKLNWPLFEFQIGTSISQEIISALSLLFAVYILGHLLAYLGSQIVEKLSDRVLGKISTAILLSAKARPRSRDKAIRTTIVKNLKGIRKDRALFPTLVRVSFHIPYLPVYAFIYFAGIFGYYNTRITPAAVKLAQTKIEKLGLGEIRIATNSKWFKPLEYYVINQCPLAVGRMYNYLIISGLFRTLSIIFMFGTWMQVYYIFHFYEDGHMWIQPFLGTSNNINILSELIITTMAYVFCLFSYIKFQRRYIEEAIFAFIFDRPYQE